MYEIRQNVGKYSIPMEHPGMSSPPQKKTYVIVPFHNAASCGDAVGSKGEQRMTTRWLNFRIDQKKNGRLGINVTNFLKF